jgi:hypothetical protein
MSTHADNDSFIMYRISQTHSKDKHVAVIKVYFVGGSTGLGQWDLIISHGEMHSQRHLMR